MLYHLFYALQTEVSAFNVFRYITFRTIYAGLTAFLICFVFGPWMIRLLQEKQIGQYIRRLGPASHQDKAGTPTMGGVLVLPAALFSTLLWVDWRNDYIWVVLLVTTAYFLIGFTDDYLKQIQKRNRGLRGWQKFSFQIAVAAAAGWLLFRHPGFSSQITIPFFKGVSPDLGLLYILFAVFVIVGTSNAVNLTDGLDGLAIGPVIIAAGTYMLFAYVAGHIRIAEYLQINYVAGCGEITVFCGALAGAGLGFLWFNAYPAQIFMGDVGSLPLGAALGTVAIITKQEILMIIVGGVFVIEAVSVILQVGFFKLTSGKRIFRMAPLHHHFELKGWAESKVIVRFWILAIMLALVAISTLKLR
ncbi:MAG: phospho-N-acetylmuramoyl-pentapeptide-transferase [Desulfosalsimonas sp.]|uniref:phospho-N-acetylmuramoyl-pentapeptide- transferase n=1 Tax=Desulfosalsimonas sp. TaxID=3073848 RepID=UPI0039707320